MNKEESSCFVTSFNDEFKTCENTQEEEKDIEYGGDQDEINYNKKPKDNTRIKKNFFKNLKNRFSTANKGSHSFSQLSPSQKRPKISEEEIFTTFESGTPTTADIDSPVFIASSKISENIANYLGLKDPKTNYISQKSHYCDSDSRRDNTGVLLKSHFDSDKQLPCLQLFSNKNSSDQHPPTIRLGQDIDQKVVENKYYSDDGNICVSPNVANFNSHNFVPQETKSGFHCDIRF